MARQPRFALPGQPQHVIQRGVNREAMFVATADYLHFLECLSDACRRFHCEVHAYVLMTNHVHLVMTPRTRTAIAKVMQSVGRRYVHYFNHAYRRTGTLWEGRYRATVIDSARYLLCCYRYVELNPVRAGMVSRPALYPWSTYRFHAAGDENPLVTMHRIYRALDRDHDRRRAAYRELFRMPVDDDLIADIRDATNKNWALGSESFHKRVTAQSLRRSAPLRTARRKSA